jgi:probable F420-dependent oxidoreductase
MQFDVLMTPNDLNTVREMAAQIEDYGFDGLWTYETAHNPFLPLTHAAAVTQRITLGTAIAVAFPRSPMVTAQIAWDLAAQSNGRFILGLGTQIKAHITRRFSTDWKPPVPRLREYIDSMRAIWANFQHNKPLRYAGDYYKFTLMAPFFSPGPIPTPEIPIYVAGVNEGLCRLAGQTCQGFHVHSFHTVRYLQELIIPNVEAGAQAAGRSRADVRLTCQIFVVTGENAEAMRQHAQQVKRQIAFYASTPSYRPVLDMHGLHDLHDKLNQFSREGRWAEMGSLISDDLLNLFAVVAPVDELAHAVKARYDGLLDRIGYYFPFESGDADKMRLWKGAADVFCS